jgi:eukaryotic-like serine/threonine-protein kinase
VSDDRWDRIKQIFQDVLDQPAEGRRDLVRWYAEDDESIIQEVESLLEAYGEALEVDAVLESPVDARVGERVGVYRLTGEIGRGGMGAIYRAVRDDDEFHKEVAVKVIKRGMDSDAVVRRFRQERQILADLDHPNIAHLLDGGTTEGGVPYFVMEYIDGQPLDQYCEEHQLSLRDKLQLFQAICDAVDYAQRRGVVHRDIKPGNILISTDGVPKLLDFGIAKMLHNEADGPKTIAGHQVLTPAYASPEQLAGDNATTASDVYSLGVVLYELLTGIRPFNADSTSIQNLARQRFETKPVPPSDTTDEHRKRRRQLRGDLDDIVLTALDPLPSRRYTSAGDLGRDIGRYLAGEPVQARRRSWTSRVLRVVRQHRYAIAAVLLFVAIGLGTFWLVARDRGQPEGATIRSMAVLPLATTGNDTEHLGLGLADAIIIRLSDLPGLTVRPTSAVRQYAKNPPDGVTIGRRLEVDAVLEGTVRRAGERVRVTVQLVRVRDAKPIWSGKFDQAMTDVLAFEDLISNEVTAALSRDVAEKPATNRRPIDPQAYQSYLRGRYLWNQRTFDSFRNAIRQFEDAIRRDPGYAAAWAGLADCYLLLGWANAGPPNELFPQAKKAAFRALQLDDSLAEAHTSLAQIRYIHDWDFAGAEKEYRRAIQLDPNYPTARQWYALFLSTMQRHDEALRQITAAQQRDPVSRVINMNFAGTLASAGRLDEAIEAYKRAIEIDPNFGNVWAALGGAYQDKGDYRKALESFEQARRLYDDKPARLQELACVHAKMGNRAKAKQLLAEMQSLDATTHVPPIKLALVHAALGEKDQAFALLEHAYATRSPDILSLADFDELRGDPRYDDLMKRIGLPP